MKKILDFIALKQTIITIVFFILLFCIPLITDNPYLLRMSTLCIMYTILALSLNLLHGYMGQMSFGHAAFFGIGAYTGALLSISYGLTTIPTIFCAIVVSAIFGLIIALPSLKLKGYYLTIVTMGFCEIIRLLELNWISLTKGPLGLSNIPPISIFGYQFNSYESIFYAILVLLIITLIFVRRLVDSKYGLAIKSIRDDDNVAEAMGINIIKIKLKTFIISACIAGVIGVLYAQYITFIHPSSFTVSTSQEIIVMIIFGGLGSLPGSFLGAITLTLLPELLRDLMQYRMLLYGIIMVVMMNLKPEGLLGNLDFGRRRTQLLQERAEMNANRFIKN